MIFGAGYLNKGRVNSLVKLFLLLLERSAVAVYGRAPRNARDPGLRILNVFSPVLRDSQKDLLHDILGVRMVADHRVCNAEHQPRVLADQRLDPRRNAGVSHAA